MAQLKDSIVTGSLRVTDTTYTTNLIISNTTAPTIATNDYLLMADASDSNRVLKGPALNTSNTSVWLNLAGAWTAPTKTTVGLSNVTNDAQIPKSVFTEAYQILYSTGNAAYAVLTANKSTTKKFLRMTGASASAGAAPAWDTVTKTDVGLSNVTNDALIPKSVFTEAYLILYATGNASYAVLTANKSTTKKFLRMTGASASAGAAPEWDTVTKSDVGLGNVTNDAQVKASLGTAKGDMLYWSAASTPARLAIGTANHVLIATANGPVWTTCASLASATSTTANTAAWDTLTLGNNANVTTTTAHSQGKIVIYSASTTATTITTTTGTNITSLDILGSTSTTANTAAYSDLILGNSANVNSTTAHSEGRLFLYSAATKAHIIKGSSTTTEYTHTLPNNTGLLVTLSGGTAKGSETKPVYIPNTGIVTECSTYAGGTKVTLNGTAKGASDITIYAPTSYGTSGYVLNAAGENNAPTWINKGNGRVFYGTCSTAAATGLKKVICTAHDKVLTNGDVLIVRFTVTNTCATSSLQISIVYSDDDAAGTTAKNIKRIYNAAINNLNAKGELLANSVGVFVYDGTYWIMTNADYNNTYDGGEVLYSAAGANRTAETAANGGIGLHRYSLEMMTANLTWSSIASKDSTAIANTTDNNKVAALAVFLLDSPIYYQSTNTHCAPGGAINVNGYTCCGYDLRYSCGSSTSAWSNLAVQKPVYLIGALSGKSGFILDATKWWGQTLPNSNDGKIYIYLGMSYGKTTIYLAPYHPVYWHDGTNLRVYTPGTTINLNGTDKTGAVISIYAPTTSGTAGYILESNGENSAPTWILATDSNTASTIVKRDADGAFSMGALTATLGTFNGDVLITSSGGALGVQDNTKDVRVYVHASVDGSTGLYSEGYWDGTNQVKVSDPKWMVARDTNGTVVLNGTAAALADWGTAGPLIKLPAGYDTFSFLTSGNGATWGHFGALGLANTYANIDHSYTFHDTGSARIDGRIYAKEWIQFDNFSGLYSPNYGAHFYPNNLTTYCPWIMAGAKGGYCGVVCGNATNYMAAMSSGEHAGLYVENRGRWIIYHQNSTNRIGIGGSTVSAGYTVLVNGGLYADSTNVSYLNVRAQGGVEGGEICFAASSSGYTAYLDVYQARFRVWATPGNIECLNVYLNTGTHSDYAEEVPADSNEPGHVYKELNNGILTKANKRLISGCSIISDTHRMCIGNVDKNGVPIAVAGRVLVYPYQDRNNFQAGMAVCSAPNGTVDIMTREEIKEYPDCILGYVAGIPDPDTWPSENVPLKGRIWIRLA